MPISLQNQVTDSSVARPKGGSNARLRRGARAPNPQSPFPTHLRRSFTLIELMVVITIIAILATITLGVVGGLLSQAKESATRATILKIQGLLNSRAQALDRLIKRKGFLESSRQLQAAKANFPTLPASLQRIIAVKYLERDYFPQCYADIDPANYPVGLPPIYPKLSTVPTATPEQVFYGALNELVLGDSPVGLDTFSASEVLTPDVSIGGGLTYFRDSWGKPLRFYRWPTLLFRSGGQSGPYTINPITPADVAIVQAMFSTLPVFSGNLAQDLARDPDDPLQDCLTGFSNFQTTFHTPATYHVLLVVSAGPDGVFGMLPPDDPSAGRLGKIDASAPGAFDDDITSLAIRAGAK